MTGALRGQKGATRRPGTRITDDPESGAGPLQEQQVLVAISLAPRSLLSKSDHFLPLLTAFQNFTVPQSFQGLQRWSELSSDLKCQSHPLALCPQL